jgi:membrane associated rhomboid family serine protease
MPTTPNPTTRARKTFWALVFIAVLATGALSAALKAHPSPVAGATVAISGLVLAITLTLATRILLALDHARRATRPPQRRRP